MAPEEPEKTGDKNATPVRVQSLSKSFGRQKVFKAIDLEVAAGQTLSVLGRSGTGKSVLLKLIIGWRSPTPARFSFMEKRSPSCR
jgi:phospholipid/cholesterol/gamma-HCH transport system ATP-binding protein